MKPKSLLHFWLKTSALWIMFALILGGKRWSFPYPFEEAWQKQKMILQKTWN